jgi:hypothetical protein
MSAESLHLRVWGSSRIAAEIREPEALQRVAVTGQVLRAQHQASTAMTTNAQGVPNWKSLRVAQASNSADDWALLRATTLLCDSRSGGRHSAHNDAGPGSSDVTRFGVEPRS